MMKRTHFISAIFLLLFPLVPTKAEQIDTLLHFNYADLQIDTVTAPDGNIYTKLSYPGCGEGEHWGAPMLPVAYIQMSLPYNAENISLNVQLKNVTAHNINHRIFPLPWPTSFSPHGFQKPMLMDTTYYSKIVYPAEYSCIKEINFLEGSTNQKKILITYYPVVYHPQDNYFDFFNDGVVSVSYTIPPIVTEAKIKESGTRAHMELPVYDYCIITNRTLKNSFRRLIGWKRQKGYNAGVVCVEDILSCPQITGDAISGLYDDAAKIRHYITLADSYLNSNSQGIRKTMYVLIGGHGNIVPFRYGRYHDNEYLNNWNDVEFNIPTDWYYCDLHSNWHVGNDICYGCCQTSEMNYFAEACVGRILCTTPEDVENYTDKLLRYEMAPGDGNYAYLQKAMFVQTDRAQKDSEAERTAERLSTIFPDTLIISEDSCDAAHPTSPTGNEVISRINEGQGYLTWISHGTPYEIMVRTPSFNNFHSAPDSIDYYAVTSCYNSRTISMPETANSLDSLSNKEKPSISYSVSCYSSPFDILSIDLYDKLRVFDNYPNMAQSFTCGKNYGGPAWIGNTRMGLHYSSPELQRQFNDLISTNTIGIAQSESKSNYLYYDSLKHKYTDLNKKYIILSTNLIGCPEFNIWTAIPTHYTTTQTSEENWDVSTQGCEPSTIITYDVLYNIIDKFVQTDSAFSVSISNCANLVSIIGRNRIPKILPFKIFDEYVTGSNYIFTKHVTCTNVEEGGDVVFRNGSDYIFESNGTFKMERNVKVEKGAKLKIIPSNINF